MPPPASPEELVAEIERLLGAWCDRRAYGPLREVLQAWPMMPLTDGYAGLRDALAGARGVAGEELTAAESATVDECIAALDRALAR